jgi:hypothetical protein
MRSSVHPPRARPLRRRERIERGSVLISIITAHLLVLLWLATRPPRFGRGSRPYLGLGRQACSNPANRPEAPACDRITGPSNHPSKPASHANRATKLVASRRGRWLCACGTLSRGHCQRSCGDGRTCGTSARLPDGGGCGDAVERRVAGKCFRINRRSGNPVASSGCRAGGHRGLPRMSSRAHERSAIYRDP